MSYKVGQVGLGFVGGALHDSFKKRGVETIVYDKYKEVGSIEDLVECSAVFLCLPTPYVAGHGFDLGPILETCKRLHDLQSFKGLIVVKSTVEPGVTQSLESKFQGLSFCHNPEFLTARTAFEDFDNQKHIVLGYTKDTVSATYPRRGLQSIHATETLADFYSKLYPDAKITICTAEESESMKLFANNFYAMKVGIFNEFNLLCQKLLIDYDNVVGLMVENGWINPMHLQVPGPDGRRGWGGDCFLKDTKALLHFMKSNFSPSEILEAAINENKKIRDKDKPR